jgi:hypothetical protein
MARRGPAARPGGAKKRSGLRRSFSPPVAGRPLRGQLARILVPRLPDYRKSWRTAWGFVLAWASIAVEDWTRIWSFTNFTIS